MLGIISLHFIVTICSVSGNSLWKSTVGMDAEVVKLKDLEEPSFKLRPGETLSTIHNGLQLQKSISNLTNNETGQMKYQQLNIPYVGSKSKSHNIRKRYASSSDHAQQAARRVPLEDDKSSHATKQRYSQYGRYGTSQANQNYDSSVYDQRDKSGRLNDEKQQYYDSDNSIYAQENVQMWPHARSQQTTNRGTNQEYSGTDKAAGHSYDQDNYNYKPNLYSTEYEATASDYNIDSSDLKELSQDLYYKNKGDKQNDYAEKEQNTKTVPEIEKYARIGNDDHGKSGYGHHDHGHDSGYGHHDHGYGHDSHGYGHDSHGHDHGGYGHDHGGYGHDHGGHGGHGHSGGYHKPSKVKKWEEGVHSKGYGTAGHKGHHGGDHQHDVKGQFKQDHHDHHKSQGSRVKTYSYGGKGWYKEQSHGNEKGYGGVKGHHQHNDWGNHKGKTHDKKKPYHEYHTKLDGYHKDHGYNYHK